VKAKLYVIISFCSLLALSLSLTTCAKASALLLSDADEEALGAEFHQQLIDSSGFVIFNPGTDPQRLALKNYLDSVFESVYYSVPSEDIPNYEKEIFVFTIIEDPTVNAFAVPGGYVYIYTGILDTMINESELAGVLAHEIAPITKHHYRHTAVKRGIINAVIDAVVGGESTLAEFVRAGFGLLAGTYVSREHEEEADESGTEYLAASYRNPRGIASFFSRMDGWHLSIISTHPDPEDRVDAVNAQVNSHPEWANLDTDERKYASKYLSYISALP
jgi:predicted Zn-dependent protease